MDFILKFLLITSSTFNMSTIGFKFIPDDYIASCDGNFLSEGEVLKLNGDIFENNVKFILEDDYRVRMVGGLLVKTEIKSPLNLRVTGEQRVQGEWAVRVTKVSHDCCIDFFNPFNLYYLYFKNQPRCPVQPGVSVQ